MLSLACQPHQESEPGAGFETDYHNREQILWRAVILRAVQDALGEGLHGNAATRELQQRRARQWLNGEISGFAEVCELAGIEPDSLRQQTVVVLQHPEAAKGRADQIRAEARNV